jgi:hypothetical protein
LATPPRPKGKEFFDNRSDLLLDGPFVGCNGDWNGDGIPNGVAYVFGNAPVSPTGKGRMPVPPSIPADVDVYLDRSQNLDSWALNRVKWENGAPPVFAGTFSIVASEVVDSFVSPSGRAFYRYRVVRR